MSLTVTLAGLALAALPALQAPPAPDGDERGGLEQVRENLATLAVPDPSEVVAGLGDVPSVAELTEARAATADDPPLPDDVRPLSAKLVQARVRGEHEEALGHSAAMQVALEEVYGPEHWRTREARHHVDLFEALAQRSVEEQSELAAAFRDTMEVPRLLAAGDLDAALARALAYQRALDTQLGSDHPEAAANRYSLGVLLYQQGEFELAQRSLFAAWRGLSPEDADLVRLHAMTLNVLSTLAMSEGRLGDAERLARKSLALRRDTTGERDGGYATSLTSLANVLVLAGELELARDLHAHAVDLRLAFAPDDTALLVNALANLGQIETQLGRAEVARLTLEEAIERATNLPQGGSRESAFASSLLARLAASAGDLAEAERRAREGLHLVLALFPDGHPDLAYHHTVLAAALLQRGDAEAARDQARLAWDVAEASPGPTRAELPDALDLLASIESEVGDPEAALVQARRSLELREAHSPEASLELLEARRRLPGYLAAVGQLAEARAVAEEVRRELEAVYGAHGAFARGDAWRIEGELALEAGDVEAAREAFARAGELLTGSSALERAACELGLARLARIDGRREEAAERLSRLLDELGALRTLVLGEERERALFAGRLDLEDLSRTLALVLLELEREEDALVALERGRALPLLDLLRRSRRERESDALDEARAALRAAEHRAATLRARGDLGDERDARLDAADGEVEALRTRLAGDRDEEPPLQAPARMGGDLVAGDWLRPGERLLEFLWSPELVARFELGVVEGGLGVQVRVLARGAEAVGALTRAADEIAVRGIPGTLPRPERLREAALQFLPDDVPEGETWIVVPDGPLRRVPLELLAPGRPYYTALSAASIAELRRGMRDDSPDDPRAVVLGAPDFAGASSPYGSLAPLAGSGAEARAVDALLRAAGLKTSMLTEDVALLEELELAAKGATLVHLATHGWPGTSGHPLTAGLALAPDERGEAHLTLGRLLESWDGLLDDCRLVTLSACDSGTGSRVGDSVLSLSWGLWHAGAECTLVSRWKVDDAATVLLMSRFYEGYLGQHSDTRVVAGREYAPGEELPVAVALTEARLWLANSSPAANRAALETLGGTEALLASRGEFPRPGADPGPRATEASFDFSHPRHWAAFVLVGAAR